MRTTPLSSSPNLPRRRPGENASAVVVVLLLIALILIYIGANIRTLHYLGRDLRLVEKQQIRRLQSEQVSRGVAEN